MQRRELILLLTVKNFFIPENNVMECSVLSVQYSSSSLPNGHTFCVTIISPSYFMIAEKHLGDLQ